MKKSKSSLRSTVPYKINNQKIKKPIAHKAEALSLIQNLIKTKGKDEVWLNEFSVQDTLKIIKKLYKLGAEKVYLYYESDDWLDNLVVNLPSGTYLKSMEKRLNITSYILNLKPFHISQSLKSLDKAGNKINLRLAKQIWVNF